MLDLAAFQKVLEPLFPGLMGVRLLELAPGRNTTTTDSSTQFIAGAKLGSKVLGESIALHRGRSTMVWQTRISNAEGRLCAVVTQTQLVLEAKA